MHTVKGAGALEDWLFDFLSSSPKKLRIRAPQADRITARPAPEGSAYAEQAACAGARARLASQDGPKEEAIGLMAMADE